MANTYQLLVITPERTVIDDQVVETIAPGSEGELGILVGHIPLMTSLNAGEVRVTMPDSHTTSHILVSGGLLEVSREGAVILADSAERVDEIDVDRAEADLAEANRMLADLPAESPESRQATATAQMAEARIRAARNRR